MPRGPAGRRQQGLSGKLSQWAPEVPATGQQLRRLLLQLAVQLFQLAQCGPRLFQLGAAAISRLLGLGNALANRWNLLDAASPGLHLAARLLILKGRVGLRIGQLRRRGSLPRLEPPLAGMRGSPCSAISCISTCASTGESGAATSTGASAAAGNASTVNAAGSGCEGSS